MPPSGFRDDSQPTESHGTGLPFVTLPTWQVIFPHDFGSDLAIHVSITAAGSSELTLLTPEGVPPKMSTPSYSHIHLKLSLKKR